MNDQLIDLLMNGNGESEWSWWSICEQKNDIIIVSIVKLKGFEWICNDNNESRAHE